MSEHSNALDLLRSDYITDSDTDECYDSAILSNRNTGMPETENAASKLIVPHSVKCLFDDYQEEADADHQVNSPCGKIRSFPHERGNWPTHLFFPVELDKRLDSVCAALISACSVIAEFHSCVGFHVSVSRTVILRHHWIQPFVQGMDRRIKTLKSFSIDFRSLDVYTNDEKTRTFIGLKVQLGYDRLEECVRRIDESLADFKLPAYYQDPSFHTSLIWCLGDRKDDVKRILPQLEEHLPELKQYPDCWTIRIGELRCKIGNRSYKFKMTS